MSLTRTRYFKHKTFSAGAIAKVIGALVAEASTAPETISFWLSEDLPDGTHSSRYVPIRELDTLCDLRTVNISASFNDPSNGWFAIDMSGKFGLELRISCDGAARLNHYFDLAIGSLELSETRSPLETLASKLPQAQDKAALKEISDRLKALEATVFNARRPLRCFLSYRFVPEQEIIALQVQKFLALLDIEIFSGASYEPRAISDKVLSKLKEPLDFVVLIVDGTGESMWTRDEIAAALHKGVAVVPLVEEGASFTPGLFGDIEYIPFGPGHIGDTFLKLLEAINFIRTQKPAIQEEQPGPRSE